MVLMELLDNNDQPSGYRESVDMDEFRQRFVFQPDFIGGGSSQKAKIADKISARAERHLRDQEYLSAEFEFNKALKLDEENVRANFGLGQTFLATGETQKAQKVFHKLAKIEAVLEPHNKHIFNEFGIQLRKQGMYAEAVRHYTKALVIAGDDEHLYFNLARALLEGGQRQKGLKVLKKALAINSEMPEAQMLLKKWQEG